MTDKIITSTASPTWHDVSGWLWAVVTIAFLGMWKLFTYSVENEKKLLWNDIHKTIGEALEPIFKRLEKMGKDIHEIKNSDKGTEGTNAQILETLQEIKEKFEK